MGEVREPSFRDDETGVECAGNQVHEVTGGTASVKSAAPPRGNPYYARRAATVRYQSR